MAESDGEIHDPTDEIVADVEEGTERRRRRPRDPFKDVRFSSDEAARQSKRLSTLSQLKSIKKARVRHDGRRVVTDDVKKLKSIAIEPRLPAGEYINYYVEPVRIEYYIPKESRFAVETKYLYIPLIDPVPRDHDDLLKQHIEANRFVDLIDVMNENPQHITAILEAYNNSMPLYESLSKAIYDGELDEEQYRTAFYLVEVLIDYEPTLASLEFLGNFLAWNLNWLVRRMNTLAVDFRASDKTVSYFIKMRNDFWEQKRYDYDERFEILAALFFEQAYPNRGSLAQINDDYFADAFSDKAVRKSRKL